MSEKTTKAKETKKSEKKEKPESFLKKIPVNKWWFWLIVGGVVLAIVGAIVFLVAMPKKDSNKSAEIDASEQEGEWIASCKAGGSDMISGGEWIVGKDIAAGDYKFTTSDKYFYAYIYASETATDYTKSLSLSESSGTETYFHLSNGQKVKVSSGSIKMECQDFGDIALISVEALPKAGSYTLISANKYTYAYLYDEKDARDYTTSISMSGVGEEKMMRFKDGQYLKMSSGSVFVVDMKLDNADELVKKAKELANGTAVAEESSDSSETSSSSSSSSSSSTSTTSAASSTSSSSSSSTSSEWKKLLKDYEAWVDKYVAFMKKYKNASASDLSSMMSEYTSLTSEMSTWSTKVSEFKGKLSGSDLTEYSKTLTRISEKMKSVQ